MVRRQNLKSKFINVKLVILLVVYKRTRLDMTLVIISKKKKNNNNNNKNKI